ncbi:MAG: Rab family GTPase, partial [Candidatus Hodarchaeota archaeon]
EELEFNGEEKMEVSPFKEEYLLKICAIGSGKVGKSEILRRFSEGKFKQDFLPTLGVDVSTRRIQVDNTLVMLILVVTTGRKFFGMLRPSYYRGASACIIFFKLNDRLTFNDVPYWLKEFRSKVSDESIPISLIGIRKDSKLVKIKNFLRKSILKQILEKLHLLFPLNVSKTIQNSPTIKDQETSEIDQTRVTSEEALSLAQKFGISYYEIDLKNAEDFEKCIIRLTREVLERIND